MEKTTTHRKKQFVPNAFKLMIAVGSMAGTFGIWSFLANKDVQHANAQTNTSDQTYATINQAPLPTLVPLVNVNITSSGVTVSQAATAVPLREVTQQASSSSPSTTVTSPSNTNPVVIPAPVTTSRSSRP